MSPRQVASTLGVLIALGTATPSLAGQERWSSNLAVGSTSGIGSEFGNAPGSVTLAAGVFLAASRHFALGLRLGRHGLGTSTSIFRDNFGFGSVQREDYSQTLWEVSVNGRRRWPLGSLRLDTCFGAGPYLYRTRDKIVTRDSTGASIPG